MNEAFRRPVLGKQLLVLRLEDFVTIKSHFLVETVEHHPFHKDGIAFIGCLLGSADISLELVHEPIIIGRKNGVVLL